MEDKEEEFDEIDWEGEDIQWEAETTSNENPTDSEPLQIVISMNGESNKKKPSEQTRKKRKIVARYSDKDYERALNRRKDNLIFLLRKFCQVVEWSNDIELQCILQSLLPSDLLQSLTIRSIFTIKDVLDLNNWLSEAFERIPLSDLTEEEGRDGSNPDDLAATVITNKAASFNQFTQIFYSLLTSFNLRVRLICSFDPLSLSPHDYDDLGDEETVKVKRTRLKPFKVLSQMYYWIEIFSYNLHDELVVASRNNKDCMSESEWIHYDVVHSIKQQPKFIETKLRKGKELDYAIACEYLSSNSYLLTDVSMKYKFTKTKSDRAKLLVYDKLFRSWFEKQLVNLSNFSNISNSSNNGNGNFLIVDLTDETPDHEYRLQEQLLEEAQLKRIHSNNYQQTLPTTFVAFQNHPVYCLERHLKVDEALNPQSKKIVAMFKGEPVYLQEHKEQLKSKLEWRKEMRKIKDNEKPLKIVKRSVRSNNDGNGSSNDNRFEVKEKELFAKSQTEILEVSVLQSTCLYNYCHVFIIS